MKFSFIFLINIILLIFISNQGSNTYQNDLDFKGIYRIDSIFNNSTLTDENYNLQFFSAKDKNGQNFRIIQIGENSFYIESKKNRKKLGVNQNGHILNIFNQNDQSFKDSMEWNIIKLEENQYVIQNNYNKKFMENNNNFAQCVHELPLPIQEHKSEISSKFKFNFLKLLEEVDITPEHEQIIEKEPIDVVIKYIDLTDKTLNRTGIKQIQKDEDNEELRYSVRSILQYIPWVRKIFIVMPNEKVKYFKPYNEIKDKFVYVKDKDVLGYESANIYAFAFNFFRLEKFGLSNNFIYMDDDFFIGKELKKSNFFYYDEKEKKVVPSLLNSRFSELKSDVTIEHYNRLFAIKDTLGTQSFKAWVLSLLSSEKFFLDYFKNITLINPTPSHNAISYNIQDLKEIYDLVINNYKYANETLNSIHRHILTLQTQHFVDLYELNIKRRKVHTITSLVVPMNLIKLDHLYIELFAINTGGDRVYTEEEYKKQKEIMKIRFPKPTPYETAEDDGMNTLSKSITSKQINNQKQIINENYNSKYDQNQENYKNQMNQIDGDTRMKKNNKYSDVDIDLLLQIKEKQALIIKYYNCLILLIILLMIILLYLYLNEKNKNKIKNSYNRINDYYENRSKIEIID